MGSLVLLGVLAAFGANPAWPASDPMLPPDALSRPDTMPDDPDYPPREDAKLGCAGQLGLYSFTPDCTPLISETERKRGLGSGVHADRAWLWTTGRGEVTVAVLGAGADWSDRDVVARYRLNTRELPAPKTSTTGSGSYDRNQDGVFTVLDYTSATGTTAPELARVVDLALLARADRGDVNGNGLLDPGDLIAVYSDGVDDDANGYTDDIAGWDFVDDDNDPAAAGGDSSGAQFLRTAVATANNGVGGAGACPRCSALALRVSMRGLAAGNELGLAIIYATDNGARVVGTAVSAIGGSTAIDRGVAYAYSNGTAVIAGAGLSASSRREVLWDPARVLITGSVGYDLRPRTLATTAVARDACSNYGGQVAISAPGDCDESAAAITTGVAGLIFSAALGIPGKNIPALSPPLGAGELYQLITANGDGRVHARAAVDALIQRRIPVEMRIVTPDWFAMIDPTPLAGATITARVENQRYERASWVLEYAAGVDPESNTFAPLASGSVATGEIADVVGTLPADSLFCDPTRPPSADEDFAVTLRLTSSAVRAGDISRGETRRTVYVHRDLDLLPGFPRALGAGVASSVRVADLTGDGTDELVVATDDGHIFAIDATARDLSGWPATAATWPLLDPAKAGNHAGAPAYVSGAVARDISESFLATPSFAALSPSTRAVTVVAVTNGGYVSVLDGRGIAVADSTSIALGRTFDAATPAGASAVPVLYDLDSDQTLELIVVAGSLLHVLRADGSEVGGFPIELPGPTGAPAIGDVDGDGRTDLVLADNESLFVINGARDVIPIVLPDRAQDFPPAHGLEAVELPVPALADIDGDSVLDIVIATLGRPVLAFRGTGGPPIFNAESSVTTGAAIALGDLDQDGLLEVATSIVAGGGVERSLSAWSLSTGIRTRGAPLAIGAAAIGGAAIADLDGDGRPEVIAQGRDGMLDAVNADGARPRHWPKLTGDYVIGAPAIADLDRDGNLDVIVATRSGRVFVWRSRGPKEALAAWPTFRHDDRATSNIETPSLVVKLSSLGSECACTAVERQSSRAGGAALLVLSITLGALLRAIRFTHRMRPRSR